ncbi:hypothetical protein BGZ79_003624 [Entomortierella chlamydospora]|nr:hypothetical protein BGZ79_003624 [Entomortierella chlamydospora]
MDNLEDTEGVQQETRGTVSVYRLSPLGTKNKKAQQYRQKGNVALENADADTTSIATATTKPIDTPRKRRTDINS